MREKSVSRKRSAGLEDNRLTKKIGKTLKNCVTLHPNEAVEEVDPPQPNQFFPDPRNEPPVYEKPFPQVSAA